MAFAAGGTPKILAGFKDSMASVNAEIAPSRPLGCNSDLASMAEA